MSVFKHDITIGHGDRLTARFTGAHVERSHRSITATVETPEQAEVRYGGCPFTRLDIEAKEQTPWGAEPWWRVTRVDAGWRRSPMSPVAGERLDHELARALQAYGGFDTAWTAARLRAQGSDIADATGEADRLNAYVRYWQATHDVREMVEAAGAEVVYRYDPDPFNQRRHDAPAPSYRTTGTVWHAIPTRVLWRGEQIGWMTEGGDIVPLTDLRAFTSDTTRVP